MRLRLVFSSQAEPVAEQTEFEVKLVKFDDKAKIKVIKEVRNILPDLKLAEVRDDHRRRGKKREEEGGTETNCLSVCVCVYVCVCVCR